MKKLFAAMFALAFAPLAAHAQAPTPTEPVVSTSVSTPSIAPAPTTTAPVELTKPEAAIDNAISAPAPKEEPAAAPAQAKPAKATKAKAAKKSSKKKAKKKSGKKAKHSTKHK